MGASETKFSYDRQKLQNIANFFAQNHVVKVGIISNEWKENPDKEWERKIGPVELGAVHEFGSTKRRIPKRSFLRLTMHNRKAEFKAELEANRQSIAESIANGSGQNFLEKVGIQWRAYVLQTFDAQGPGWKPLAKRTIRARRKVYNPKTKRVEPSHKILWVTGALARSVSYEVVS